MTPVKDRAELLRLYGDPLAGGAKWWREFGREVRLGPEFAHVRSDGKPWRGRFWCHRDIRSATQATFADIAQQKLAHEIHTYDGCYVLRAMRRSTNISIHSWGYAIDLNAAENTLGEIPKMSPAIVAVFKSHGWIWGGDWKRPDGMHFQLVRKG